MSKSRKKTESAPVTEQVADSTPVQSVTHVKMVRDAEKYPAPHTADVHVTMVDFYSGGGWVVKED